MCERHCARYWRRNRRCRWCHTAKFSERGRHTCGSKEGANEHTHRVRMGLVKMLSEAEYQAGQSQCSECGSLISSLALGRGVT